MKAKHFLSILVMIILSITLILTSCDRGELQAPNINETTTVGSSSNNKDHTHSFSEWEISSKASCINEGTQKRTCGVCGFSEYSQIPSQGHTETIDAAIAATCTTEGKTEGKHCSVCNAVLVVQNKVPATGHKYDSGKTTKAPTCQQAGEKTYTCTVASCKYTYTESVSLPTYTANELYNKSVKYVGEIIVYDKTGAELGLATGFVMSTNGKIVTNYHVIEDAYSAKITIDGKTYPIEAVLAYDENIDLAILKINASNLTTATICKKPVQVGETVYAMGSSRGMTNTYSQGIITYADRVVDGVSHIQHDASITHGNSGGPLINAYGEVIGINTWGISDSQNLNFAVFADELDNLVYRTPMSLAEFYEENFVPHEILKEWVAQNANGTGNYTEVRLKKEDDWFGIWYDDEGDLFITNMYWYDSGAISSFSICLSGDEKSLWYGASYEEGYKENRVNGHINANTFTKSTPLTYYSYEGDYWTESSVMDLHQGSAVWILNWFEYFLEESNIGLTMQDFGFNSFS